MKKILIAIFGFALLVSVPAAPASAWTAAYGANYEYSWTADQSDTQLKLSYHYAGIPQVKTKVYAWLGEKQGGAWINRNNLLLTISQSSSPVTKDFNWTIDFSALNLKKGSTYFYQLWNGTTDSATPLSIGAEFTPGAPDPNTVPTNNQNPDQPNNPTNPSAQAGKPIFALVSVKAPAQIATIRGILYADGADIQNGRLVMKIGPSVVALTSQTKVAYSGLISSSGNGTPVTVASDPLDNAVQIYYYKFTETTTGTDVASGSFRLNQPDEQLASSQGPDGNTYYGPGGKPDATLSPDGNSINAPSTVNGACGKGANVESSFAPNNPCAAGTASAIENADGTWKWTCKGKGGGSDATCTAPVAKDDARGINFLQNPLAPGLDTFPEIFAAIMNNIVFPIAIPFLVIMFVYAGFSFVIAKRKGSTDGYETAKKRLMYTVIGAAIILSATLVANALAGTISDLFGGGDTTTTAQ